MTSEQFSQFIKIQERILHEAENQSFMLSQQYIPLGAEHKVVRGTIEIDPATSFLDGNKPIVVRASAQPGTSGMLMNVGFGHNRAFNEGTPANYLGFNVTFEVKINNSLISNWGQIQDLGDFNKSVAFNDRWQLGIPLNGGQQVTIVVEQATSLPNFRVWGVIELWSMVTSKTFTSLPTGTIDLLPEGDKEFEPRETGIEYGEEDDEL